MSDYGLADEFVGVVHAVLARLAPGTNVVDLTHGIRRHDVRAGAAALVRSVPYLGPGVVLAVVDPGVGGARRAVAVQAAPTAGPAWYVGPDNGLLVEAASLAGPLGRAVVLARAVGAASTFDGRDVFAPAAAALCAGVAPESVGDPLDTDTLVRLAPPICERWSEGDRGGVRAEVTWVDGFGNVQLAATATQVPADAGPVGLDLPGSSGATPSPVLRVRAFADLPAGVVGLLTDANGHLALVVDRGSAAEALALGPGDVVTLSW